MKSYCFRSPNLIWLFLLSILFPVEATWWFLSKFQLGTVLNPRVYCNHIPGLDRQQRQLCHRFPQLMIQVGEGVSLGISECQRQFQYHRWNCSTLDKDASVFGKSLIKSASKESAFVYAISSAGVTYAISRACSRGDLTSCQCDNHKVERANDAQGEFTWSGCSANTRYASNFAQRFIDARESKTRDSKALVNMHNNRVGRKAVHRLRTKQCKCHGISGSCSVRTCWQVLPNFQEVGSFLKQRYDKAVLVTSNPVGTNLVSTRALDVPQQSKNRRNPKIRKNPKHLRDRGRYRVQDLRALDLVYLDPSPDYCAVNLVNGSLGTAGRACNRSSGGPDGCNSLCCGSGYDTRTYTVTETCNCTFKWCCSVECKTCTYVKEEYTCKPMIPYEANKV